MCTVTKPMLRDIRNTPYRAPVPDIRNTPYRAHAPRGYVFPDALRPPNHSVQTRQPSL
ncbi:hypothetical protein KUIN1_38050 [Pseudomonas sp. KUIN-1]|nr:hypothetical protein KUIN1_38050 [Pseudomonas sp. KUIN-1]